MTHKMEPAVLNKRIRAIAELNAALDASLCHVALPADDRRHRRPVDDDGPGYERQPGDG